MTPGGVGLFEWTAIGGELKRGWGHEGYTYGGVSNVFSDTYAIGDTARLWLDYHYLKLDGHPKDQLSTSTSTSGVTVTRWFSTTETYMVSCDLVSDIRITGSVSDYSAFMSFYNVAMRGTLVNWYPDWENYPSEYYPCKLIKRHLPTRNGSAMNRFRFDFELTVLPTQQFPSTIPSFP